MAAKDGARFEDQSDSTQAAFRQQYGNNAAAEWEKRHNAQVDTGVDPGASDADKARIAAANPRSSTSGNGGNGNDYGPVGADGTITSGIYKGMTPQSVKILLDLYQQSAGLNRIQVEGQLDIARKQLGLQGQSLDLQKAGQALQFKLGSRGLDIQQELGNRGLDLTANGQVIQQQLGNRGLDIQQMLGMGQLGVSNRGLDIQQLLGQQGLDTQRELGLGQLGLGQGQLNLSGELGRGNLALQQTLGLGGLEQQKRAIDLQYAQMQQIGIPQAELDRWKSEQEIALAKQAQATNENRLGLDTMQALAQLGGPADYFQAADLAAGLKQRQAGGPVFLNRLLSGESGPAFNAPGGIPDVQSAQTLGAQMGQDIGPINPANIGTTYNPLRGNYQAPPRPAPYTPPPSSPSPQPLPFPMGGGPSVGPNYPGGMNPTPNPPRNLNVAPNPGLSMPNPSTFNTGGLQSNLPRPSTWTQTPSPSPTQLPNPSTFGGLSPQVTPTNVPKQPFPTSGLPDPSTFGTIDDPRKRSKASKQQNKQQKVAA